MRIKNQWFMSMIIVSIIAGCSNGKSADWAYYFVVWDGYVYKVSNDYIEAINQEIWGVTKYSDREGTYLGIFQISIKKVLPKKHFTPNAEDYGVKEREFENSFFY